jgi:hypothetical protein
MTARTLNAVLHFESDGSWTSEALTLPSARIAAVLDQSGTAVPFEVRNGKISTEKRHTSLVARIELEAEFVAASDLEQSKLALEREKVASSDRLGRRTLIVTVVTALVSAGATIAVATIANPGGEKGKTPAAAYRDLNECRDGLNNLKTLAGLDQQTLTDLRMAVRRQVDDCVERLRSAMAASPP